MTNNDTLLTGQERDEYIAKHFTPEPELTEEEMNELDTLGTGGEYDSITPVGAFETWYDNKTEEGQEFIDIISDSTSYITEEHQYDDFITELASYGIETAEQFENAFEGEAEGYGERVTSEFAEELIDACGYTIEPAFIANCIDWSLVWYGSLRFDYQTVEFNGYTYFFRNV